MTAEDRPKFVGVNHVGLPAQSPSALAEFYQDVMGMQLVGSSTAGSPIGESAFLSSRPNEESHELVFFANPAFKHVAFKVATLADLRAFYQHIVERGWSIQRSRNHGVSLAFYFHDPEDNLIEVYWPTGLNYGQPYGHPIDLTLSEDALLQDVAELAAQVGAGWPER